MDWFMAGCSTVVSDAPIVIQVGPGRPLRISRIATNCSGQGPRPGPPSGFSGLLSQGAIRAMIEALRNAGGTPVYVEYPDADHDSWTQTYAELDNIQWLFDQRREAQ